MRLDMKSGIAHVGNIHIHGLFSVVKLDAGHPVPPSLLNVHKNIHEDTDRHKSVALTPISLKAIESDLTIVIPCMNEEHFILDGVLHGVPHDWLVISVSNSDHQKFTAESEMLAKLCTNAQRKGIPLS